MSTDKNKNGDKPRSKRLRNLALGLTATTVLAGGMFIEYHYSSLQAKFGRAVAEGRMGTTTLKTSDTLAPSAEGPYDERNGYTSGLEFRKNIEASGFTLESEHEYQERKIAGLTLSQIYKRKTQTGLQISDENNHLVFDARFPRKVYTTFDEIPPIVANSLLFVENRALMKEHPDTWNPAIEWPRFLNATLGYGLKKVGISYEHSGGSTLATQIEKFQHAPNGITGSGKDKLTQMFTASVRAYMDGGSTADSSRETIREYLNFMPLTAYPGAGEVIGFPEGMALWYDANFAEMNKLLQRPEKDLSEEEMKQAGKSYRQALSLVMAVKKPNAYLVKDRAELEERIDKFLPLMAAEGIISPRMRDAALASRLEFADPARLKAIVLPPREKTVDALQIELMQTLKTKGLYELRRLDMSATTTVDGQVSKDVQQILRSLADEETAKAAGITGFQLLKPEAVSNVVYAYTLYERMPDGTNVLRVQTDNFQGQLNLNEGTKLELGSTAKLRTLVSYLEAFSFLHEKFATKTPEELKSLPIHPDDNITKWAVNYFTDPATDKSLKALLEASLDRRYHGSPHEGFFTGGGVHRFENFEPEEDYVNYTVKEAFHLSVNLSFVRMMRDIVYFTETNKMGIDPNIFTDPESTQRREYLEKFADKEGTTFLWRAWAEQKDKTPEDVAALLADKGRGGATQVAVIHRSMFPNAPYEQFEKFMLENCEKCEEGKDYRKQYDAYAKDKFDLNDRAYLTNVHPLALWLASYKIEKPNATWKETVAASADARQETYEWLFNPRKFAGQNTRIRIILEQEAFQHIHKTWQDLGYSFSTMVPSYASALGSSGDTPASLATLSGIIQNNGLKQDAIKFRDIKLAQDTPYRQTFNVNAKPSKRVLPAELTELVRREMQGVVEEGTGRRIKGTVKLSDGRVLPIGGKTGTGDNRMQTYAKGGAVTSSDAKNRTGTFVYAIDDRFYGCITAYVDGPEAAKYKFTSGLAVQVLKNLLPAIQPVLDKSYGITPEMTAANKAAEAEKLAAAKAAKDAKAAKAKPAAKPAVKPVTVATPRPPLS